MAWHIYIYLFHTTQMIVMSSLELANIGSCAEQEDRHCGELWRPILQGAGQALQGLKSMCKVHDAMGVIDECTATPGFPVGTSGRPSPRGLVPGLRRMTSFSKRTRTRTPQNDVFSKRTRTRTLQKFRLDH